LPEDRPDERGRRVAENEATFRRANERLREAYRAFGAREEQVPFICECADSRCTRVLMLTTAEYEDVRAQLGNFLVLPGHELSRFERVTADHERFRVVEKAAHIAETPQPG
jgi:hypothetical protein